MNGAKLYQRSVNPTEANGQMLTCIACVSLCHILSACSDMWENLSKVNPVSFGEVFRPILFTSNVKVDINQLVYEELNCAVLVQVLYVVKN